MPGPFRPDRNFGYGHPGGRELFASALAIIVYKHAPWIERYEIVQEREGLVVLRAVPTVPPRPEELSTLKDLSSDLLGAGVEFRIETYNSQGGCYG